MGVRISKSRFQKGLQCEKALWLLVNRRDLATPVDEAQQWIFDQGTEVGRLAHRLFPRGTEVAEDHLHPVEALETTRRLLAEGATVLYEPAFEFDGAFARIDILVAAGDRRWDLFEVKSTAQLKDEHVTDAAMQAYTVEGAGLPLRTINVVHLNSAYVYEGGDYDVSRLFTIEDVTEAARAFMPSVHETLEVFRRMLEGPEPGVRIGSRCNAPYACEFSAYCRAELPDRHPVTDLPNLSEPVLHELLDLGITCIEDIPDDFWHLTPNQRATVNAVKSGVPRVDTDGLATDLAALTWPVYHLDFETIAPALPLWPGTRPYQLVPFQYSVHVHHEDGSVEHREYLHEGPGDPRRPLAENLLADLEGSGSIAHYTAYEVRVIDGLAVAFPDLAEGFAAVEVRLFDLAPLIKNHTTHPDACGRWSIKYVLPAWCPDLSYEGLGIADGNTASVRYVRVARGETQGEEAAAVFADLTEYCALDTFAMVRLLEEMRRLAGEVDE